MPRGTQTIAGVERALDVISLFADTVASDLGVTEIAEHLELSKAVVHRILSSFRVKGFIELDETTRRYRIGPRALTVGLSYLNRVDQVDVVRDALEELARATGETVTQSVRAGDEAVYVGQVPSRHRVRVVVDLGTSYPLHRGSASKVLLAYADDDTRAGYLGNGHVGADADALATELDRIRERGHAVAWDEPEPGIGGVSAPLRDRTGRGIAALTVCGPAERFRDDLDSHTETLMQAAMRLSQTLGFVPVDGAPASNGASSAG